MFKLTITTFGGQIGCHLTERQDERYFDTLSDAEGFIAHDEKCLLYSAADGQTIDYAVVYNDYCQVDYRSADGKEWTEEVRYSITEEEPE